MIYIHMSVKNMNEKESVKTYFVTLRISNLQNQGLDSRLLIFFSFPAIPIHFQSHERRFRKLEEVNPLARYIMNPLLKQCSRS